MRRRGFRRSRLMVYAALVSALGVACLIIFLSMFSRPAPSHPYFPDSDHHPLVIAHRGGSSLRPENTLEAFAHADRLGADVLEMDVRRTKDGALVVMHDPTVDRTTDSTGAVSMLTLDELKRLDAGYRFSSPDGRDFPFRGVGVKVPTLKEVFDSFPRRRMVVEIKRGEPVAVAEMLCTAIHAHGRSKTTLVASVSDEMIREFRRRCPEVATSAASEEARAFLTLSYTHLTATYSPDFVALQVPPTTGSLPVVTRGFVEAAHKRNLVVHPWTINDESEMRRFLDIGVDGIITDRPDLLLNLRRERRE